MTGVLSLFIVSTRFSSIEPKCVFQVFRLATLTHSFPQHFLHPPHPLDHRPRRLCLVPPECDGRSLLALRAPLPPRNPLRPRRRRTRRRPPPIRLGLHRFTSISRPHHHQRGDSHQRVRLLPHRRRVLRPLLPRAPPPHSPTPLPPRYSLRLTHGLLTQEDPLPSHRRTQSPHPRAINRLHLPRHPLRLPLYHLDHHLGPRRTRRAQKPKLVRPNGVHLLCGGGLDREGDAAGRAVGV